jgi:hypothetical protein
MNENKLLNLNDESVISNKNLLPVATLVIIQPNTIIPTQIIEAEVVNFECNHICLIS